MCASQESQPAQKDVRNQKRTVYGSYAFQGKEVKHSSANRISNSSLKFL